jgi:hypothetical protein
MIIVKTNNRRVYELGQKLDVEISLVDNPLCLPDYILVEGDEDDDINTRLDGIEKFLASSTARMMLGMLNLKINK